ncbi:rhodanese-like domain-containing protein [uncultured Paludibaculum sp.]|uniref:rhodanese-like domain-containing protein n=1 Tax=uncultured Paludibaculum sp. TaxID=1765020 RepID=UPI002AAC0B81|nr:rhodanese-like domain-containing protein [uncultured Paludibaculum sp.]
MAELSYELTPAEAKSRLDAGDAVLIDVREPQEHQICSIEGAELIPMNTVPQQLQHVEEVADEKTVIVFCHHGVRSLNVVTWLRRQGVDNCISMSGGIDAWSAQIDPTVPRY